MSYTLSLVEKFALISLNEESCYHTRYTMNKRQKSKCLTASILIEIYLWKQPVNHTFNLLGDTKSVYIRFLQENLTGSESKSLSDWISKSIKLPIKDRSFLEELIVSKLKNEGLIELFTPLLDSDLLNTTANIKTKEYRMNQHHRQLEIEYLKADLFEDGNIEDDTIVLLWLIEQANMTKDIFSSLEINELEKLRNKLYKTNALATELFPIEIRPLNYRILSSALNIRTSLMETQFGLGVSNRCPGLYRKGSIFIETEELFSSSSKSLNDVLRKLRANGHNCIVKTQDKVSLVEIDGILYEFVPDVVTYGRAPVSGIRLRKYKM